MNPIVKVLMHRDELSEKQAIQVFLEAEKAINRAIADGAGYDEIEYIMMYDLGLEMDYIYDILD